MGRSFRSKAVAGLAAVVLSGCVAANQDEQLRTEVLDSRSSQVVMQQVLGPVVYLVPNRHVKAHMDLDHLAMASLIRDGKVDALAFEDLVVSDEPYVVGEVGGLHGDLRVAIEEFDIEIYGTQKLEVYELAKEALLVRTLHSTIESYRSNLKMLSWGNNPDRQVFEGKFEKIIGLYQERVSKSKYPTFELAKAAVDRYTLDERENVAIKALQQARANGSRRIALLFGSIHMPSFVRKITDVPVHLLEEDVLPGDDDEFGDLQASIPGEIKEVIMTAKEMEDFFQEN